MDGQQQGDCIHRPESNKLIHELFQNVFAVPNDATVEMTLQQFKKGEVLVLQSSVEPLIKEWFVPFVFGGVGGSLLLLLLLLEKDNVTIVNEMNENMDGTDKIAGFLVTA